MDVSMPVMSGMEATQRIRQYEMQYNLTPTPIIALTAHASVYVLYCRIFADAICK